MALIDRGRVMIDYLEILGTMDSYKAKYEALCKAVDEAPAVDAVPVVRCSECKGAKRFFDGQIQRDVFFCNVLKCRVNDDEFCSRGARMDKEESDV